MKKSKTKTQHNMVWHHYYLIFIVLIKVNIVKPVLRGHLWHKENVALKDRWPLKKGSIHMKLSMTWQEKCDLLIQVTA
jgi:hypothetical protein